MTAVARVLVCGALAFSLLPSAVPAHAQQAAAQAASEAGGGAKVETLQIISRKTPFKDNCGDPGTPFVDAEVEPHVAVNPVDPNHLVAAWQQDRYPDGGARSDLVAVSKNGGIAWSIVKVPGIGKCTDSEAEHVRNTDPRVSIGPNGAAYFIGGAYSAQAPPAEEAPPVREVDFEVVTSTSANGGLTWAADPAFLSSDDGVTTGEKPEIVADPTVPGRAYAVWPEHTSPDPTGTLFTGDPRFARTEDAGATWSESVAISSPTPPTIEEPLAIVPAPQATGNPILVVILTRQSAFLRQYFPERRGTLTYLVTRSEDLGETWSEPVAIADVNVVPFNDPEGDGSPIRAPEAIPELALAPDGALWVVWYQLFEPDVNAEIRYARYSDLGETWQRGVVAATSAPAFLPTVAVNSIGAVGVTYYDFRNDASGDDELTTDVWFAYSTDDGGAWKEQHLAGPFNMRTAPNAAGLFVGDYQGLVGLPDGFGAVFVQAKPEAKTGPTDVFFARITISCPGTAPGRDLIGSPADDILVGTAVDDVICGLGGDDSLRGGDGNDVVIGSGGDDRLVGDEGDDVLLGGGGTDQLSGASGNDTLDGGPANDLLIAGDGNDVLRGQGGDDRLLGRPGDDRINGGPGADALVGAGGDDAIVGEAGDDELFGQPGRDKLDGGGGNDTIDGGPQNDSLSGGAGDDTLNGGPGRDRCNGGDGVNLFFECEVFVHRR
ncbi:MAG: hypothetical protein ACRDH6_01990 [Actinomycetota bacterium]